MLIPGLPCRSAPPTRDTRPPAVDGSRARSARPGGRPQRLRQGTSVKMIIAMVTIIDYDINYDKTIIVWVSMGYPNYDLNYDSL
jgi:hypothetical protein